VGRLSEHPALSSNLAIMPRSRIITAIAIFAALAIALHISPLKLPAPYAPFLIYELWEIPIVTAFILFGIRVGGAVAVINFLSLMVIFPGQLQAGPIYNLLAIVSMMLGMLIAYRIADSSSSLRAGTRSFWLAMVFGIAARVVVMTPVNALLLPLSPPLGFNAPIVALEQGLGLPPGTMLLFIAIFNSSVAVYTIPLARIIATFVSSATRIPVRYGR
jgi:riboflavin transporter FmnP